MNKKPARTRAAVRELRAAFVKGGIFLRHGPQKRKGSFRPGNRMKEMTGNIGKK